MEIIFENSFPCSNKKRKGQIEVSKLLIVHQTQVFYETLIHLLTYYLINEKIVREEVRIVTSSVEIYKRLQNSY